MTTAAPSEKPTITPMMIPSGNRQLMAVHHAPASRARRDAGVVMCNQIGPDYTEFYKTSRLLVNMLVAAGFDCLRFDYTGWGDSQGGVEDGSVEQWLRDIAAAEATLREQGGCSTISLCGFGFGGLLAAMHAATCDVDALVLWEPVLNGQSYCRMLRTNHKAWLRGSFVKAMTIDKQFHQMGFPATADLERQMTQLQLANLASCRVTEAFVIVRDGSSDHAVFAKHFGRLGVPIQTCDPGESLPLRPMRAVVAWLERQEENEEQRTGHA